MDRLATQKPSTHNTLRQLNNFLKQHHLPDIVFVHGFLTATISSPDLVMPSEWIDALGLNDAEFESMQECELMIDTIMTMYNRICHDLLAENFQFPDSFSTIDNIKPDELKKMWVSGYLGAVDWNRENWLINDDVVKLLFPMMVIHLTNDMLQEFIKKEISATQADELRTDSEQMLPDLVNTIYSYWKTERDTDEQHVEAPIREKVGRNASCPCGSGKKYKRCCLTASASLYQ